MSSFYVVIETIDPRVVTCAITTMDDKIKGIPVQPTFALGLILDLWWALREDGSHYICKPEPDERAAAQAAARNAAYAKDWEALLKLYVGYEVPVSQEEYEQTKETWMYHGHKVNGLVTNSRGYPLEETGRKKRSKYALKLAPDFKTYKTRVDRYVTEVSFKHLQDSDSFKAGYLTFSVADAAMVDFMQPGMEWGCKAAR